MDELERITLYGHKATDLIILAELYRKKGIILEEVAEAFTMGYKMAQEDFYKATEKVIHNVIKEVG